jgi:hypothetical protein
MEHAVYANFPLGLKRTAVGLMHVAVEIPKVNFHVARSTEYTSIDSPFEFAAYTKFPEGCHEKTPVTLES